MTKILTTHDMFFSSFGGAIHKIIPKRTILELVTCRYDYEKQFEFFSATYWTIVINTEDGELFSYPFVKHSSYAPMEERRPFIYLENE